MSKFKFIIINKTSLPMNESLSVYKLRAKLPNSKLFTANMHINVNSKILQNFLISNIKVSKVIVKKTPQNDICNGFYDICNGFYEFQIFKFN